LAQTIRVGSRSVYGCFSEVTRYLREILWICVAASLIAATWTTATALVQQPAKVRQRLEEDVNEHTRLGVKAAEANDLKAAERHFAAAASLAPSEPSTRNNYGAILMRLGRTAEARAEFEASLKLNPDQPSALTNLAQIYFDAGQADDLQMARSLLERAAKITADPEISRALVTTCLKLGQVLTEKGDLRAAGRTLEGALASGLDDARIYAALADVYQADGHFENAIPAMRLAVQRDPQNESYHFRYGLLLTDSHAPGAGIVRLQEALKQFPGSARLWLGLGIAQLTYGQNVEAESSFKHSLAIDPKAVPALAYLGVTYAERGLHEQAISFYEQALALNPQLATLHYLVADTLLKNPAADTTRAEKSLKRTLELDPKFAAAYLAWGRLHFRAARYAEAAPLLERAVALQPELLEAHYQLSRVLMKLKRTDEANRELEIFKQLSEKQKAENEPREIVRRLANVRF
jgi:Tfp pilus assembly protein PilF